MLSEDQIDRAVAAIADGAADRNEAGILEQVRRERNDAAGMATMLRGVVELDGRIIASFARTLDAIAEHQGGLLLDFYTPPAEHGRPEPSRRGPTIMRGNDDGPPSRFGVVEALSLLESAWGIIANASDGRWEQQSREWYKAAVRWRDEYHEATGRAFTLPTIPPPTSPKVTE